MRTSGRPSAHRQGCTDAGGPAARAVVFPFALSLAFAASVTLALGCRDTSRFSSGDGHYEGSVVDGSFVRAGVEAGTQACLLLDAEHLQDAPGTFSTSDGRFASTPLRPIPQLWHDPLSTMTFGEGRLKNLMYALAVTSVGDAGASSHDAVAVVSLLQSGEVEVRVFRGAPAILSSDPNAVDPNVTRPPQDASSAPIFAVFPLTRKPGPCAF